MIIAGNLKSFISGEIPGLQSRGSQIPLTKILCSEGSLPLIDRINYATLMYYHSVINSEKWLVKEMVTQQEQKQCPIPSMGGCLNLGPDLETTSK